MKQKKTFNSILVVLMVCFLSQNIFGQESNSLENLMDRAEIIIIGTVAEINSQWNKDKTSILTFVKINIEENIKGNNAKKEITVRVLGGEVEEIRMHVSNSPEFKVGERYLCFLQKDTDNTFAITGWEAGKFISENGYWTNKTSKISYAKIVELKEKFKTIDNTTLIKTHNNGNY